MQDIDDELIELAKTKFINLDKNFINVFEYSNDTIVLSGIVYVTIADIMFRNGYGDYDDDYKGGDYINCIAKEIYFDETYYNFINEIFDCDEISDIAKFKYYYLFERILFSVRKKLNFRNFLYELIHKLKNISDVEINFICDDGHNHRIEILHNVNILETIMNKCNHESFIKLINNIFSHIIKQPYHICYYFNDIELFDYIKRNYNVNFTIDDFNTKLETYLINYNPFLGANILIGILYHLRSIDKSIKLAFIERITKNYPLNEFDIKCINFIKTEI